MGDCLVQMTAVLQATQETEAESIASVQELWIVVHYIDQSFALSLALV